MLCKEDLSGKGAGPETLEVLFPSVPPPTS